MSSRILFDVTKAHKQKHKSGLVRVSECLRRELKAKVGDDFFVEVVWDERKLSLKPVRRGVTLQIEPEDVFITAELFCEYERPGIEAFLIRHECRTYSIFHDAIPLQHPEFTWPHSVQRHPSYMKMLSLFDGAYAVSQYSSMQLEEYWQWLGFENAPSVKSIQLGADGVFAEPRGPKRISEGSADIICLGIIEKRKGQDLALQACEQLWNEGIDFTLHYVGRANPYFGRDIEKLIKISIKNGSKAVLEGQLNDSELLELFERTDLTLFPSRAEGCGLPVLESLWKGVPVLCSNLNPVRETSRFGGCRLFESDSVEDLVVNLRELLTSHETLQALSDSIKTDMLPRWSKTVKEIVDHLESELVLKS